MADIRDGCKPAQKRWERRALAEGAPEAANFMSVRPAAQREPKHRKLDQPGDQMLGDLMEHQFGNFRHMPSRMQAKCQTST
ncbi:hypothetical protein [Lichenicoccus sp.]|uniref:hypothetical protein n=1 Tax=Lichenicoccus sp. TaxID=2781899 RepID=UPI003D0D9497